jgi:hypothetical protein
MVRTPSSRPALQYSRKKRERRKTKRRRMNEGGKEGRRMKGETRHAACGFEDFLDRIFLLDRRTKRKELRIVNQHAMDEQG